MNTLYQRTARQALQNQPTSEPPAQRGQAVNLTAAELELILLALGLLLSPAAATLQARLGGLRP